MYHANPKQKYAGLATLMLDELNFKERDTRNKEGHSITVKGLIQQENITILSLYATKNIPSKYTKQKLSKLKIHYYSGRC